MPNTSNSASTNWGYKYIAAARDHLIRQIEGSNALNAYPQFRDRDTRADELISELLGSEPCLFYIRRQREARNPEYEIWELIIATDRDNFQLPTKLQERQQTLQFWASVRKDGTDFLELTRINLVDLEQGQIDAFSSAWLIRLLPYIVQDIGIPQEAFAQIATMPVCGAHVPTTEQIRVWGQYLGIQRRTAEKRQFCVPFVSHNYPVSRQRITFTLNVDLATSNGSVSLTPEEFWQRAGWASNGFVKLFENSAELANRRQGQELGDIETVEKSNNQIKIQLNSNLVDSLSSSNLELPTTGFLFFEDVGSLAQISWQEQALGNLREGHTQNLYLGEFFFDAAKARPIPATSPLSKTDLLLSEANETQIAAVEAVLAAEDLILIQGPPGTGKTTVIAEICYQVARRGGRTLVVSQANLAVDNALSRLAHHPLLRPLREGDARTRVGREGEPFLAHRVIDRWLENTAADCENRLSEPRQIVKSIGELLTSLERFTAYIQIEENFPLEQQQLLNSQADLELVCQEQRSAYQQAAHNLLPWETLANDLSNLIESASSANWEDPNIKELVESLTPYLTTNDEIHHLYLNVERCQQISAELDLTVPPYPPLGLAFWFRDVMSEKIQTSLTCVNDSVAAMSAIERQREWQLLSDIVMELDTLLIENYRGLKGYINKTIDYFLKLLKGGKSSHTQAKKQRSIIIEKYAILQKEHTNFAFDTADQKLHHLTELLDIPKTWQDIAQQYLTQPDNSLTQAITLEKEVRSWQSKIEELLNLCLLLEPLAILNKINQLIYREFEPLKQEVENLLIQIRKTENSLNEVTTQLQKKSNYLEAERNWWQSVWQRIPERLKRDISSIDIFNPKLLKNVSLYFDSWQKELAEAEAYLNRYEATMQKWIDRLLDPSDTDLEAISKKYLENVNVVGITCMKAANRSFSQKFSKFDVVIIDEVSKSTPPELLIPALKGKKVVMIGDYRQLPPILDEENLDELADELKVPREKVQFLENSWFKQQFEAATSVQKGITQKLNIQYRMHPQIMEAINQFYNDGDGGLSCGLTDPDNQRSHNVGGKLIREDQHIIWVKIPSDRRYQENRIGTSYQNTKEVACIEKLCQQMNKTWAAKVANGEPKKEIGIITFYGAQLRLIDERISRTNRFPNLDIRTGTVDRFQGMEKSVVIVSMVRNNHRGIVGFAKTPERVNVAFSRAKELLVIVGCHDLFTSIPIYKEVSKVVERYRGFIDVSSIL